MEISLFTYLLLAGLLMLLILVVALFRRDKQKSRKIRKLTSKINDIEARNNELIHQNSTKDTMIRNLAHDLRNPMSVMISFTDLLEEEFEQYSQEEIMTIITNLNKASRDGLHTLDNLSLWAKSKTGKLALKPQQLSLITLATEAVNMLKSNAMEKQIDLRTEIPPEMSCFADVDLVSIILKNFLSNAIKFTHEGGTVILSAFQEAGMVSLCITDTGIGMKKEAVNHLFNTEIPHCTSGTADETGSGIGLILCKLLVEKQGGSIRVDSEEGKGSRFCFSLPQSS